MPIISDRIIEIKSRFDLYEEAVRFLGPPRRVEAGIARWCCPWHDERTPSFGVNTSGQHAGRWRCWGACAEGGDVLDFLQKMGKTTLREELRKSSPPPPFFSRRRVAESPQQPEVIDLRDPPTPDHPALEKYPAWLEHRQWDPLLAELIGLEFVVDARNQPRIRFPFRRLTADADPCFHQDRAMFSTMNPKWMAPKGAIPCPFEAWRLASLARRARTVFVCEGLPDVLALLHVNPNLPVIGIPGAGAFKKDWVKAFRGMICAVVIADNDKAGQRMREMVPPMLDAAMDADDVHQLTVPPPYKDVDEWRQADTALFPSHFAHILGKTLEARKSHAERAGILGLATGPGGRSPSTDSRAGNLHGGRPALERHPAPGVGGVGPSPRRLDLVCGEAEDRQVVDGPQHLGLHHSRS